MTAQATSQPSTKESPVAAPRRRRRATTWFAWIAAHGMVLAALRPTWLIPLQGDDMWLVLTINRDASKSLLANSLSYMDEATGVSTRFNPIGLFLNALLKGAMLDAPGGLGGFVHHATITVLVLACLPLAAVLLRQLVFVTSGATVSTTALAIPVAAGFVMAMQITAVWAYYDPLVAHPIFGALPTTVGLLYIVLGIAALLRPERTWRVVAAACAGVVAFLVYEIALVFVAAVAVIGAIWVRRGRTHFLRTMTIVLGPPLLTWILGRLMLSGNPTEDYSGTAITIGPGNVAALVSATYTSAPGSQWGTSGPHVDFSSVPTSAIAVAVAVGLVVTAWAASLRRLRSGAMTGRAGWAVLPIGVLLLIAPMPYVVSEYWSNYLLTHGATYMHSLVAMWCWAMAIGLALYLVVRNRRTILVVVSVVLVTAWSLVQADINRQLAADLVQKPLGAFDVLKALTTEEPEAQRCAALDPIRSVSFSSFYITVLNREYDERFGTEYCPLEQ